MFKKLLAFLGSNECIAENEYHNSERFLKKKIVKIDKDFSNSETKKNISEFFNIEKDKHYNEYVKLFSNTDNCHPAFLLNFLFFVQYNVKTLPFTLILPVRGVRF